MRSSEGGELNDRYFFIENACIARSTSKIDIDTFPCSFHRKGDVPDLTADPSLAEKELGFTAPQDLETMCRDLWNWQTNNPNGYDDPVEVQQSQVTVEPVPVKKLEPAVTETKTAVNGNGYPVVAVANGADSIIINSGGRSEKLLQAWAPGLPAYHFIQYGNWIGETLAKIRTSVLRSFVIGMMLGKAVKLAAGHLNTHSNESSWDKDFIEDLAGRAGYPAAIGESIRVLNKAGRLAELFPFRAGEPFYLVLAAQCRSILYREAGGVSFIFILIEATGQLLVFPDDTLPGRTT